MLFYSVFQNLEFNHSHKKRNTILFRLDDGVVKVLKTEGSWDWEKGGAWGGKGTGGKETGKLFLETEFQISKMKRVPGMIAKYEWTIQFEKVFRVF